jgi:hypothetical protein
MRNEKKDTTTSKVVLSAFIIFGAAILVNAVLGPDEDWGATYDDLGRTVTAFLIMGVGGLLLWLLWRKRKDRI